MSEIRWGKCYQAALSGTYIFLEMCKVMILVSNFIFVISFSFGFHFLLNNFNAFYSLNGLVWVEV